MPPMSDLGRIYEDIGSLKATVSSIDSKLGAGNREFQNIRRDQSDLKSEISLIKAAGEIRSDAIDRIETAVAKLTERVDTLVALRHRVGGAFFLASMVCGAIYEGWSLIEKFVTYIGQIGKMP